MAPQIKTLFDTSKDIYRTIEKVITYSASQQNRLKDELAGNSAFVTRVSSRLDARAGGVSFL